MKKILSILAVTIILLSFGSACKKQDENSLRLVSYANGINERPNRLLSDSTILKKSQYIEGDSVFIYFIKVPDSRYDQLGHDSIKKIYSNSLKTEKMRKIVNILKYSNVGARYDIELPQKEISIIFSPSEIVEISNQSLK